MAKLIMFIGEDGVDYHNVGVVPDDTEMVDMLPIMSKYLDEKHPTYSFNGLFPTQEGNVVNTVDYSREDEFFLITEIDMFRFEK
jgi:hypothetical protein